MKLKEKIGRIIQLVVVLLMLAFGVYVEFIVEYYTPKEGLYGRVAEKDKKEMVIFGFRGRIMRIAVYYNGELMELAEFEANYKKWRHIIGSLYWSQDGFLGFRIKPKGGVMVTQSSTKTRYVRVGDWDGFFSARTSRKSTIAFRPDGIEFEQSFAYAMPDEIALFKDEWEEWSQMLDAKGKTD